jgi:hypothetical protein
MRGGERRLAVRFHKPLQSIVEASKTIFGQDLVAVVVKGSTIRGDFISYYSDLDVHLFLHDGSLTEDNTLWLDDALKLQPVVERIDPERLQISSVQIAFNSADHKPLLWSPTPREVKLVLYGNPPEYDLRAVGWRRDAETTLLNLDKEVAYEMKNFTDRRGAFLSQLVRRQGTFIKGGAYSLAALVMGSVEQAQLLPYWRLDEYLSKKTGGAVNLAPFHVYAHHWKIVRRRSSDLRDMFNIGIHQLGRLREYRRATSDKTATLQKPHTKRGRPPTVRKRFN